VSSAGSRTGTDRTQLYSRPAGDHHVDAVKQTNDDGASAHKSPDHERTTSDDRGSQSPDHIGSVRSPAKRAVLMATPDRFPVRYWVDLNGP
jgi:hypothetical protein